ncbi:MAG: hypothetical protein HY506_00980 [Candidatus Yanofskybacteria bacterium]|nr:hypothetical protein [Candidatus Yanofskybacteria bacterium]
MPSKNFERLGSFFDDPNRIIENEADSSRRDSDAKLTREGADFREGKLLVPNEIIEKARQEMEKTLSIEIPETITNDSDRGDWTGVSQINVRVLPTGLLELEFKPFDRVAGLVTTRREIVSVIEMQKRIALKEELDELDKETRSGAKRFFPMEQHQYIDSINKKHWGENAIGSRFLEGYGLRSLIKTAIKQRGGLDGDDRKMLEEMGVNPQALMPECRYLVVKVPGEVGIVKAGELPDATPVRIVRTKTGTPCSLVVEGKDFPKSDIGTIIIGPNEKQKPDDPEPTTKEMIWTAHPGLPIRPAKDDSWPEGTTITVADVKAKLGENAYLQFERTK